MAAIVAQIVAAIVAQIVAVIVAQLVAAIKQETCCRSAELRQASQILRNVASWSAKHLNVGFEFIYFMKGRTIHQTFGIGLLLLVGRKQITSLISSGPGRWETWERSLIKSMRTAEARYDS